MRLEPSPEAIAPINLNRMIGLYRVDCPSNLLREFDAYASHVGRHDFDRAQQIADAVFSAQLSGGKSFSHVRQTRQAFSLSEKLGLPSSSPGAEEKTWSKFVRTEDRCRFFNSLLKQVVADPEKWHEATNGVFSPWSLGRLREKIAKVLGSLHHAYPTLVGETRHGPGSTLSSRSATETSLPYKLSDAATITSSAIPIWNDHLASVGFDPSEVEWYRSDGVLRWKARVNVEPGCKLVFVPKTSTEFRTIAAEPSSNVCLQLAVHSYLERRLSRFCGIDLQDQSRNQSLAIHGSRTMSCATIDLSSASDSICIELVRLLLPEEWFFFLDALRSGEAVFRSNRLVLEKFSSSGNGFTFVLETLLFWAISALAVEDVGAGSHEHAVYGDDIIVPIQAFTLTTEYLKALGFLVNDKKSFAFSSFRESCGMDAYDGGSIRPVFLRALTGTLVERVALHNQYYRHGVFSVCKYLEKTIPPDRRLFGPAGSDAGFLFTEEPSVLAQYRRYDPKTQSYVYKAYREVGRIGRDPGISSRLEAALLRGGVYSTGAPLRYRTRTVRHPVNRG